MTTTQFRDLQVQLGRTMALNKPGAGEHVLVALPSFSAGESLLSHYAERIPALEHRYLVAHLMLHRIEACEMVFVSCDAPSQEVLEYYTSLVPAACAASVRARFRTLIVEDRSARSVAAKLLDQPDLLDELRASFKGRPAFIEPWNVTEHEVKVALHLGAPINGTDPALWPLGFKSAGRRVFVEAGVPVPWGVEDVRSVDDVMAAVAQLRRVRPRAPGAVVKLDNSGAGDGNVVLDLRGDPDEDRVRRRVAELPAWYLEELGAGGVVEERVVGTKFTSPSVQLEILADADVVVLATHEQILGGDDAQVYTGCRFPADGVYAAELARHGRAVGESLARRGVVGRLALDFAASCDDRGRWEVFALEVNLRKGGTTHPYTVLRNLVPGHYDAEAGSWRAADGTVRFYRSTDNLVDEAWVGLAPRAVIGAVAAAGLQFDIAKGTGVVLHMLSCLAIDGRLGLTAIAKTAEEAQALEVATAAAIKQAARQSK